MEKQNLSHWILMSEIHSTERSIKRSTPRINDEGFNKNHSVNNSRTLKFLCTYESPWSS